MPSAARVASRVIAAGHFLWGAVLLAAAAYWGYGALSTVGHMVTGTFPGNLLIALILAATWAGPLLALGLWLGVLGRRIWQGAPGLRRTVVRTHRVLLVPGLLALALGIFATRQAARNAEAGGGIGEPLAWVPLLFGAPMVALSLASLLLVREE